MMMPELRASETMPATEKLQPQISIPSELSHRRTQRAHTAGGEDENLLEGSISWHEEQNNQSSSNQGGAQQHMQTFSVEDEALDENEAITILNQQKRESRAPRNHEILQDVSEHLSDDKSDLRSNLSAA
jgi:hypothetical protein